MYKLLPEKAVNKARREYSLRRIFVSMILLSVLFIFSGVATLPSFIFALEKKNAALFTLSSLDDRPDVDNTDLEAWAEQIKTKLTATLPNDSPDQPYTYFQKILAKKTSGVTLTGFVWTRQNNGNKSIRLNGVAKTRQDLLSFQSSLSESGDWAQADLPVSAIARELDIPFEITLTPQKTQ